MIFGQNLDIPAVVSTEKLKDTSVQCRFQGRNRSRHNLNGSLGGNM